MRQNLSKAWVVLALCLSACSTVQQTSDVNAPPFSYKADLQITVDGKTFDGLAVTAIKDRTDIIVNSPIKADRVQVMSCSRNDVFEKQKLPFTYTYIPSPIESQGLCLVNIQMFDKNALTAWGLVAFRRDENLKAHTFYNAEGFTYSGFSLGQSKAGLEQSIEFPTPVDRFAAEPNCNLTTTDQKLFLLRPQRGVCRMTFRYKDAWHRSLFIGYDSVLIRQ